MSIDFPMAVLKRSSLGDPPSEAKKPRNKMEALGQVFTSALIAREMVRGLQVCAGSGVVTNVLDPCVGTGALIKALHEADQTDLQIDAYEIDESLLEETDRWSSHTDVNLNLENVDYLFHCASKLYDFAILNPPYVRQEWIVKKKEYKRFFADSYGVDIPGTSNLYVYFIVKVISELRIGGKMSCIVYDSWQSTNFGRWLKHFLNSHCSSWRAEAAPPMPFQGHLIDATIIYAQKGTPGEFVHSDSSVQRPLIEEGVSRVSDLFDTKRGLRLKQTSFFMTDAQAVESDGATPFIKKVASINGYQVNSTHPEAALLIKKGDEKNDERTYVAIRRRLAEALEKPEQNIPILTWYNSRPSVWAEHTIPAAAPILFNYYLRNRPRHILNSGLLYSDNFYGLTPYDHNSRAWFAALNSSISVVGILDKARNQGNGLAKLQLFEYRDASVLDLRDWEKNDIKRIDWLGQELAADPAQAPFTISRIDQLVASVLAIPEAQPLAIKEILAIADLRARKPRTD